MTTRREMLLALGAMALVPGCSSSGGNGIDAAPGSDAGGCGSTIELNHGHALTVPAADVAAGTAQTYDITGAAAHAHSVSLSAADFSLLRTAGMVIVTSTTGGAHTHTVTVRCA